MIQCTIILYIGKWYNVLSYDVSVYDTTSYHIIYLGIWYNVQSYDISVYDTMSYQLKQYLISCIFVRKSIAYSRHAEAIYIPYKIRTIPPIDHYGVICRELWHWDLYPNWNLEFFYCYVIIICHLYKDS